MEEKVNMLFEVDQRPTHDGTYGLFDSLIISKEHLNIPLSIVQSNFFGSSTAKNIEKQLSNWITIIMFLKNDTF